MQLLTGKIQFAAPEEMPIFNEGIPRICLLIYPTPVPLSNARAGNKHKNIKMCNRAYANFGHKYSWQHLFNILTTNSLPSYIVMCRPISVAITITDQRCNYYRNRMCDPCYLYMVCTLKWFYT